VGPGKRARREKRGGEGWKEKGGEKRLEERKVSSEKVGEGKT